MAISKIRAGGSIPRRRARGFRRPFARRSVAVFAALAVLFPSLATVIILTNPASAAIPPIAMTFFVPIPEEQALTTFESLTNNASDNNITNVVSIIATQDSTVIEYDHWEDGLEPDPINPAQSTTEVWGDGDATNGCSGSRLTPPVVPCNDADDFVREGDVFIMSNVIPSAPRNPANFFFDGGDRVVASTFIVVSQSNQPTTINGAAGSLIGGAVQVYDTIRYGTEFITPLGEDLTAARFNRLGEFATTWVMASEDNTTVTVDNNGDGTPEITQVLNAGESLNFGGSVPTGTTTYPTRTDYNFNTIVNSGTTINATAPVQAYMAAASRESLYQARFFELVPTGDWDNEYFAPISTVPNQNGVGTADASLFLFNPYTTVLNVTLTFSDGSSTVVPVPAGSTEISTLPLAQQNSGVRVASTSPFFAAALIDTNDSTATGDWGLTLLPAEGQTRTLKAGWAPGSANTATENSNPIWLVASDDATVYIDYGGDGVGLPTPAPNGQFYDIAVNLQALELYKIFEADNDQTGTLAFTLDNAALAGAWGQDGSVASTGTPGLDLGTTVFPGPAIAVGKTVEIIDDINGNGLLDPGETIRYTVRVENDSSVTATDVLLTDTPDPNAVYVATSTTINAAAVPDDVLPATPFPLDEGGYLIASIGPASEAVMTYDMTIDPDTDPLTTEIINTVRMESSTGGGINSTLLPLKWPSLAAVKSNDDADGIVDPGQIVTYTVELTNTDNLGLTQTNVNVSDLLPAGVTYVPQSTVAVGTSGSLVSHYVEDTFTPAQYSNNGPADTWSADWAENGEGTNPGGGRIQIVNDQLRLVDIDGRTIERFADLSDPSITTATLSLDFDISSIGNEGLLVEMWNGSAWETVRDLQFDDLVLVGTVNHTLTAGQINTSTGIRFRASDGNWNGGETAWIDNVRIDWSTGSTTAVTLDNIPAGVNADLIEGDPSVGNLVVPGDGFAMAAGDKLTITYQGQVNIDATFDQVNTATAVSTESPDPQTEDSTVTVDQPVELDVARVDTLNGTGNAGDTIDYAITVTNPTNLPITGIDLVDSLGDADLSLTCTPVEPFTLAAGASATCSSTHTITQVEVDAGEVTGFVTATGTDYKSEAVSDLSDDPDDATDVDTNGNGNPDDPTVTPLTQTPELQVTKVDTLNGTGIAGDTVDYDITVTNTGNVTIDNIGVSDTLGDANTSLICTPPTPGTLAPGANFTCTSTHTITQGEVDLGQVSSTAVAAGTDPGSNPVTDIGDDPDDPSNVDIEADGEPDDPTLTPLLQTPLLEVVQTDTLNGTGIAGDTIDYNITVTNTGTVTLTGIDVTNTLGDVDSSITCAPIENFTLAPGASATCTGTHTVTQSDVDSGSVTSTATAQGSDPSANPVSDLSDDPTDLTNTDTNGNGNPDDPNSTPLLQTALLEVVQTDTLNGTGIAGDTVDYNITVTNTGTVTLNGIDVTSDLTDVDGSITCTPVENFTLAPGTSASCTGTHTVTQSDVDSGSVTSTATAQGSDPSANPVSDLSDDPTNLTDTDTNGNGNPDDPNSTPLLQTPVLDVVQTDTLNGTGIAGDTIDYAITVTNTGTVTVSGIDVTNTLGDVDSSITCTPIENFTLAPSASATCSGTHTITQAEVDSGSVTSTATAQGSDPSSNPVSDLSDDPTDLADTDTNGNGNPDDANVTPLLQAPALQVTKLDTLNGTGVAGDTIDYAITVTNTGTVTVSSINLTDSLIDANLNLTCTPVEPIVLAPGASATCTSTHTVTQSDVDASSVSSSVTASGQDPSSNPVSDLSDDPADLTDTDTEGDGEPDDPTVTPLLVQPSLSVTQSDTLNGTGAVGDTIDYAITVTNDGTVTVSSIDVANSLGDVDASISCTPVESFLLAPGANAICTGTHTITQADLNSGSVTSQATATGQDPSANPVSDLSDDPADTTDADSEGDGEPDDPTVTPLSPTPLLEVLKVDTLNGTGIAGDTIDYVITITNTGNVTATGVTVSDDIADVNSSLDCSPTVLPIDMAPSDSFTCTATHTIVQADVDAGSVSNTARAAGLDPGSNPLTDMSDDPDNPANADSNGNGNPDDPTVTALTPSPELQVVKVDTLNGTGVAGDTIDYDLTVTNTGNVTITGVTLVDAPLDANTSLDCLPTVVPVDLAPGESFNCTSTHTVTQTEVNAGQVSAQATASGLDPFSNSVTDLSDDPNDATNNDSEGDGEPDDPTVTPLLQTSLLEVVQTDTLNGTGIAGDTIDYAITVTNTGTVTVSGIDVTNSLGDVDTSISCTPAEAFGLAPGATATCSGTHTVTQADVDSGSVSSTATAQGSDPSANPVSDLSDDPSDLTNTDTNGNGNPDDPTVTPLLQTALLEVIQTDTLNGTGIAGDTIDYAITVTNTGTVTLTGIDVTNSLGDVDGSLACTPIENFTLAPGASATCSGTHTVTQSDVDSGSVTSTATAQGSDPSSNPVSDLSDDPTDLTNTDSNGNGNPDDPNTTPLLQTAVLDVVQTDTLNGTGITGDTIDYNITVTNTGTVTVSGIDLTNSLGDVNSNTTCAPVESFALTPGASATCTGTHTVTQSDVDNGSVTSIATAQGSDPSANPVTDISDDPTDLTDIDSNGNGNPDDPNTTPLLQTSLLEVTQADTLNGTGIAGDTIDYAITVTNTGTVTVDSIDLTNSLLDASLNTVCSPVEPISLAPGASGTCVATHTITQADVDAGTVASTATAAGEDPSANPVSDLSDDPADLTNTDTNGNGNPDDPNTTPLLQTALLEVIQTDTLNGTGIAGDTIDYNITVTNTGTVTLTSIDLTNSLGDVDSSLSCTPVENFTLAPGSSASCTGTHTVTQADVDTGTVPSTATATGEDPAANPVSDLSDDPIDLTDIDSNGNGNPDDPNTTPLLQTALLDVVQTDTLNGTGIAGDTIDYAITVTNTGTVTLTSIDVTNSLSDVDASISCTPIENFGLIPGATATCSGTHTVTQADVDNGSVTSTATAQGSDPSANPVTDLSDDPSDLTNTDTNGNGNPDDPNTTPLLQTALLDVVQTDTLSGTGIAGDTIDYAITVTNTGTVTLTTIDVTSNLGDVDGSMACTPVEPFGLAPSATATCSGTHTVTQSDVDAGTVTSTATAQGSDPSANPVSDLSDDPTDLTDTDSNGNGNPDDPNTTPLLQTAVLDVVQTDTLNGTGITGDTIDYNITVTNTGTVTLTGIDVTNSLSDVDSSLTCTPVETFTLAPGASATCSGTHTVTQAEVDNGSVSSTATAQGSDPSANPVSDLSDDPTDLTDTDSNGNGNPDDPNSTPLLQTALLEVIQTDTLNGTGIAGDTIDYNITVTNTGTVTLTSIDVTSNLGDVDSSLACTPVEPFGLTPGATSTCTGTHTITQAEVNTGVVSSAATAAGQDPSSVPVSDLSDDPTDLTDIDSNGNGNPDDPNTTPLLQTAVLDVVQTDTLNGTGIAGDTIDYNITVTNTGTVTLTTIDVTSNLTDVDGSLSCTPIENFTLAPGASATCSGTHTITQGDVNGGSVSSQATAQGSDPSSNPVADLSDDPTDLTDIDSNGNGNPDDPNSTPLLQTALLEVVQTDTLNGTGIAGDTIDYNITVTNTGTVTLTSIDVASSLGDVDASLTCTPAEAFTLAPGASATCSGTHTITQAEVDAGSITAQATAQGSDPSTNPVSDLSDDPTDITDTDTNSNGNPDDPNVTPLTSTASLSLTKTDTLNGSGSAGDTIDYVLVLTNTGSVTASNVTITNSLVDVDASLDCSPDILPVTLLPGGSVTCTATHTLTQPEVDSGQVVATAAADGTDPGGNPIADASDDPDNPADVDPNGDGDPDDPTVTALVQNPGFQVTKTDTLNGTGAAGDTIDYVITITNTGSVTMSNLTVADSLADADAALDCSPTALPTALSPGGSFSCTTTHTITQAEADAGQVSNTATATGENPSGQIITDASDDPDDPTDADPDGDGEPDDATVTTLNPSRELQVSMPDTLNGTGITGDTIDYPITVTNTGETTVSNISVAAALSDADASLLCAPGEPFSLAPGASATCTATHTVTQTEVDSGQVVNTVAVAGVDLLGNPVSDQSDDPDNATNTDPDGDGEPDDPTLTPLTQTASLSVTDVDTVVGAGVAGDTITYAIDVTNDGTVTISGITLADTLPDSDASLVCTPAEPMVLAPGATATCTSAHTITQADVDSGTITSSVTASGTDPALNPVSDVSDDPDNSANIDTEGDGEPDDPTVTALTQDAVLDVSKVDTLNGTGVAGDTIDYVITVTNTGTVTIDSVSVIDSLPGADTTLTCTPAEAFTLLPGASASCTSTYTLVQADVDAGSVSSFVTASGTDPAAAPVSDLSDDPADLTNNDSNGNGNPDDPTITSFAPVPGVSITKTDTLNGTGVAGDTITYSIVAANTGTVTLSSLDITDSLADADASLNCAPTTLPTTLAPGQTINCTSTHTITQAEVDAGQVTSAATVDATDPGANPISDLSDDPADTTDADTNGNGDPDDPTVTPLLQTSVLEVTKSDVLTGIGVAGDPIVYTITVANTGTVTATVDTVTDPGADGGTLDCSPATLPTVLLPGESFTCTSSHVVTQADVDAGQVSNNATASGTDSTARPLSDISDDPADPTDTDTNANGNGDDPTVTPLSQAAELQVTYTDSLNGTGIAGDTIDYTIVVVNSGTVTVDGITVTDDLADADATLTCAPTEPVSLAPGASTTCTSTHTVTQAEVDSGLVTSFATATGTDPGGNPVADLSDDPADSTNVDTEGDGEPDDPTVTTLNGAAALSVLKTDVLAGTGVAGDTITYTVSVENVGAVTISDISVTDSLADADASITCLPGEPFTLAPNATASCTSTHVVTQAEVDLGVVSSNATAAGLNPSGAAISDTSDDPDDPTDIDANADGEPDDPTETPLTQNAELQVLKTHSLNGAGVAGDTIDYTITVANTGTVTVSGIDVSDSIADADASLTCVPTEAITLAPGANATCTATHTITQAEVDAGSVSNTATAAGVDPSGNPVSDLSDDPGNGADVDLEGDGEPDDPTVTSFSPVAALQVNLSDVLVGSGDAGDSITYSVTVANTGTVTLTDIDVSASLGDVDASISCSPAEPFTLAPSATSTCAATHTITQADVDAGQVTVTATATGLDPSLSPVADLSDDPDDLADVDSEGDGEPDDPTVTSLTQTPELQLTQTDLTIGTGNPGDTIDYTITVNNTGNVTITAINVTHTLTDADTNLTCTPGEPFNLTPGATATCTATHTITQPDVDTGSVTGQSTATGQDPATNPVTDLSDNPNDATNTDPEGDGEPDDPNVTTLTQTPSLTITQTDSLNGTGIAGDTIDYTITATNTGNVTLDTVDLTSDLADINTSLTCTPTIPTTLAPGATTTCTATHTITQPEVDTGNVTTQTTGTATDPTTNPVTDQSDDPDNPTNTDPDGNGNPDDPTTTPLTATAELQVTQADVVGGSGSVGDTITYAVVVQNTGDLTVTGIALTNTVADVDASLACSPAEPFGLAPGASASCVGTHTITQADLDAGQVVSSAEAAGTTTIGSPVVDSSDDPNDATNIDPDADGEPDDPTVSTFAQTPAISLTKAAVFDGNVIAGNSIDYTLTAVNTGNVTLSNVTLTDVLPDANLAIDCAPASLPATLAPGQSLDCTTNHTITQTEIDTGSVTNTAAVASTDPNGAPVTDDSDDPADATNVDPNGDGEPDDPTVTLLTGAAQLEVTNVDILAGSGLVGDLITYTITTTNTGELTLDNIGLTNSLADADASLDCGATVLPATLTPGASFTCTAVHTLVQLDLDTGSVTSTATATATDPSGTALSDLSDDPDDATNVDLEGDGDPDDPTVTDLPEVNELQLIMTASAPTTAGEGDPINYTLVVINAGLTTLTDVTLAGAGLDPGSIDCSPDTLPLTLAPGSSLTCTATHTITVADLDAEQVIGTATVSALSPGGTPITDISDDPTDTTDVDTEGDGEPDDPSITTLLKPSAGANTIVVNETADPSRPIVADVASNASDPDGSVDPTSVNLLGGTDIDGDGTLDELIVPGEGVWTVDRATGTITFVPEAGFTNNPTPVLFTVADDQGIVSQPGELAIDYPPAAVDDTSVDNPFATRAIVNVVNNDTVGDAVVTATLQLVGGVDTTGDGYADALVVAGEGVWRANNVNGRVSFKPDDGFVGDPTPVLYLIEDGDGRPTQAQVSVAYQPQPTTSIEGRVFNDTNANGSRDATEPDISGVTVTLTCGGPDGTVGTGDDTSQSTITASPYRFDGITIGDTCVVTIGNGLASFPIQTADPDNNQDGSTTISVGAAVSELDFGFRAAPPLSLTGANSSRMATMALLLILLGLAFVYLPQRIEEWREPEYW